MRRALAFLVLLLLPALAHAELSERVKTARNEFEFGRYANARDMAFDLIARNLLFSEDDRIEANRIAGLGILYTTQRSDEREKAEPYFVNLLRIDPDYQLDPFFTPPAAVAFFDKVRRDHDPELGPIRDDIRRRREEQARREAAERARLNAPKVVKFSQRTLTVAFLPLGAGQFQNGDVGLGITFATVQVAALATSIGTFVAVANLRDTRGDVRTAADQDAVHALRVANWTSLGVFAVSWIASSVEAFSGFQPEVEIGSTVSLHGSAPARFSPVVSPLAGGGLLGLQMGF